MIRRFNVRLRENEMRDITDEINYNLSTADYPEGAATLQSLDATTAIVLVNEKDDLIVEISRMIASRASFTDRSRSPVNISASIKTAILGGSLSLVFEDSKVLLPVGKRVFAVNFEGEKNTEIVIHI